MKLLGYLADREDSRDRDYSWGTKYGSHLPIEGEVDLWFPGMEVRNQGNTNSCTGYAGASALQMALNYSEGDPGVLSGTFLYYTGRSVWGGQREDGGSYLRTLMKAIQLQGACEEKVFTADAGVYKAPPWRSVKNAFKHKGVRSYRLIETLDDARAALSRGAPLVGGWSVGPLFLSWSGGEPYNGEGSILGGHAMAVRGYHDDQFTLVNSYGSGYGEGGMIRVTSDFLMERKALFACDTEEP